MPRRKKNIPIRQNIAFLAPLASIAWTKVGLGVLAGTLGIAGAAATFQYLTTEDPSPQYQEAIKRAEELLQYGLGGGTDPKYVSASPSLINTPTNLYFVYAMVAFYAARAGIESQNTSFFQLSQEYLDKIGFFAPTGFDEDTTIAQALQDAVNKMNALPDSYLAQKSINAVAKHADPTLVQAEKNTQAQLALDPLEPWRQTAADATKPFTLAAGLVSGKCPVGWDCKTFRNVQIAIYGLIALTVYSSVRDFLPKRKSRR
jgi:hypothetical protein